MSEITDWTIQRDFRNRPWVTQNGEPLEGEIKRNASKVWYSATNAKPYGRMSGLADILDDKSGLVDWAACSAAVGLVRDPGLYAGVAALASAHRDPWSTPEAKWPLKELVGKAKSLGGSDQAAQLGTAYHSFAEQLDFGVMPEFMPPQFKPLLEEYRRAVAPLEMLLAECFVACDELERAGSFDRVVRFPDGSVFKVPWRRTPIDLSGCAVVADVKSGKHDSAYPMKPTIQIAGYAHGVLYDQESGKRTPIHPDLRTDVGLLIHHPIRTPGSRCSLYLLDLEKGWDLALLAERVRCETKFGKLKELEWSA